MVLVRLRFYDRDFPQENIVVVGSAEVRLSQKFTSRKPDWIRTGSAILSVILKLMRITVFGASGKVGRQVVALALARRYEVTVFVHRSNPFADDDRVRVVSGEISDAAKVAEAVQGSQAVISTLGSWHTKSKDIVTTGVRNILPVMKQQGIRRIITVTGAGALWSGDQPNGLDKAIHKLLALGAAKILADGEGQLSLLAESGLDWTCIRSPVMTKSKRTNYHLTGELAPLWAVIPRAAVVQCLVDQIESNEHLRAAPIIRSGT